MQVRMMVAARLLTATLANEPNHPQIGALVETLIDHGRASARMYWNTQDYGSAVSALAALARRSGDSGPSSVRVLAGGTEVARTFAEIEAALSK